MHQRVHNGKHKVSAPREAFSATYRQIQTQWKVIVQSIPQELFDEVSYTYEYPEDTSQTPAADDADSAEES